MFGRIGEGDISAMLIYTVVIVILCALIYRVLSGSFINIVTSNNTVSKVRYKEKKSKMKINLRRFSQKNLHDFLQVRVIC